MEYDPVTDQGKLSYEEMTTASAQPYRDFTAHDALLLAFRAQDTHHRLDEMIQEYQASPQYATRGMVPHLQQKSIEALTLSRQLAAIVDVATELVITDIDCEQLRSRRPGYDGL